MKDLKHIKRFNESDENFNISDVSDSLNRMTSSDIKQLLLLIKSRIQTLQFDINKIDNETINGRLNAMYNQIERILNNIDGLMLKNISDVKQSLLLFKSRIQVLQFDIYKIDKETVNGRLNAMYNQIKRMLDEFKFK